MEISLEKFTIPFSAGILFLNPNPYASLTNCLKISDDDSESYSCSTREIF